MARQILDAGQLTARLVLQVSLDESDGQGGVTRQWQDKAVLWGAVKALAQSTEEIAGGQRQTSLMDIWVMMRSDVSPMMRLLFGERVLTVLSARSADRSNRFLIIRCREEN